MTNEQRQRLATELIQINTDSFVRVMSSHSREDLSQLEHEVLCDVNLNTFLALTKVSLDLF